MEQLEQELISLKGDMGKMKQMLELLVSAVATSFLSPADVASRLNIRRKTVLAHLSAGYIEGKKIEGEWRIPATEIVRLLEEAKGNHFSTPECPTRRNKLLTMKGNEVTTRKAKRKAVA